MTGPVCPACGVAVLPGYVRCPKCRKPLPRRVSTVVQGGTALENKSRAGAIAALAAAVLVGGGIIAYFGMRDGDKPAPQQPAAAPDPTPSPTTTAPALAPGAPEPTAPQAAPTGPNPVDLAADLERALKRQRLWSTVSVEGSRVDVRSGSCADAAMAPVLDGAAAGFKAAGLTKMRCVEQSGRVVSDREL